MSTDHRAAAEHWLREAENADTADWAQNAALIAIAHALLAEPKPPQISRAQWGAER